MPDEPKDNAPQPKPEEPRKDDPEPHSDPSWDNINDWGKDSITKEWEPKRPGWVNQMLQLLRREKDERRPEQEEHLEG